MPKILTKILRYLQLGVIFMPLLFPLGIHAQSCGAGEIEVIIKVFALANGEEIYWDLTPADSACGNGTIVNGGNHDINCDGGGLNTGSQNGYSDFSTHNDTICLVEGAEYSINWTDDFGDQGGIYSVFIGGFPVLQEETNGVSGTITFTATPNPSHDAFPIPESLNKNYSRIPLLFASPLNIVAKFKNFGSDTLTTESITFNIYYHGNVVFSEVVPFSTVLNPQVSSQDVEPLGSYTPQDTGLYIGEYITSIVENDSIPENDTVYTNLLITLDEYARDNNIAEPYGITNMFSQGGNLTGNTFFLTDTCEIASIKVFFRNPPAGEQIHGVIYSINGTFPDAPIANTTSYTFQQGDSDGVWLNLPTLGGPKGLLPGNYYFGIYQDHDVLRIGISLDLDNAYTSFISENGGLSWYTTESVGLINTYMIRPILQDYKCPLLKMSSIDDTCSNGTGVSIVEVIGGGNNLSYEWQNGNTSFANGNLAPGVYSVTVSDGGDCEVVDSVEVVGFGPPNVSTSMDPIVCFGGLGGISGNASGLTGPFYYEWNTGTLDDDLIGVPAGFYTLTVTDRIGCDTVIDVFLSEPDEIVVEMYDFEDSLTGYFGLGSIVSGGTPPYSYQWLTNPLQTTPSINNVIPGALYTLVVTDSNNCTSATTIIGIDNKLHEKGLLEVFPNPVNDKAHIIISDNVQPPLNFKVLDLAGREIRSGSLGTNQKEIDCRDLSAGIYMLKVEGKNFTALSRLIKN